MLLKFITNFKKKSFLYDSFKISSGTALSQLITISVTPIITRIFVPEVFGVYAVFIAITGIIAVISCLRYELAIVLAKSIEEAGNLFFLSIFLTLLITLFISFIIILAGEHIIALLNVPGLKPYLWFVPVYTFSHGIFTALNHWNTRNKMFGRLAVAEINRSVVANGTKIFNGATGYATPGGLIIGQTAGRYIATIVLGIKIWKDDRRTLINSVNINKILDSLKNYKRMALYNGPASLINMITQKTPTFMLALFFPTAIVGYYVLVQGLLKLPTQLIGGAVRKVFFQRASISMVESGSIGGVVKKTLMGLVIVSMAPFTVAAVVFPDIFGFLFGENWQEAGLYARWLIPSIFMNFITVPISTSISVHNREGVGLSFQSILFVSKVAAFTFGGLVLKDPLLTIILSSVIGVLYNSLLLRWIMLNSGVRDMFRYLLKPIIITILFLIIIIFFSDISLGVVILISSFYLIAYVYNSMRIINYLMR